MSIIKRVRIGRSSSQGRSHNDPTVPARSGEMSDSHIGPSGPCAGLRKMFLRRK